MKYLRKEIPYTVEHSFSLCKPQESTLYLTKSIIYDIKNLHTMERASVKTTMVSYN